MAYIKVDPNDKYPRVYWPEELKRFGYAGEVEVLCDPVTGTIIHPGATPEQIIRSLENRIRDIHLRRAAGRQQYRPLENNKPATITASAPEAEWEDMQCPYPDCGAALRWHAGWDQATCSRCGRPIGRQKP